MPGGADSPSWVKLNATVLPGSRSITVDADVSSFWPVGGTIAIASSDYAWDQSETAVITALEATSSGGTLISLSTDLKFTHWGDAMFDEFGEYVDERAEVALLNRNIVISGLDEPDPWRYEGGHFIVHQTNTGQHIEGVEFNMLGQQGVLGRYSLHFHICGDTQGKSVVRKNSIWNSKQRCVVNHASHNLTADYNVAYNTSGHCFMLEEGGEMDNTFLGNLGMLTQNVDRVIMKIINGVNTTDETDGEASTFWFTNLQNDFIDNVGAGSEGNGMWVEMKGKVRGASLQIPELASIRPLYSSGGVMRGNVLHSNQRTGLKTYPHGIRPPTEIVTSGVPDDNQTAENIAWEGTKQGYTISGLNVYKHRNLGAFFQATGGVVITRSTFADNLMGIFQQSNTRGVIRDSRFIGYTANHGSRLNASRCAASGGFRACAPMNGCVFPPREQSNVRSVAFNWLTPQFGIIVVGPPFIAVNSPNGRIFNCSFSGFDPSCRPAAGISFGYPMSGEWSDAAIAVQDLKVAPGTPAVWFAPPTYSVPLDNKPWTANPHTQTDLVLQDRDGSVIGGETGGYVVANNSFLLPPNAPSLCTPLPNTNTFGCPGTCYRTVYIDYSEDAFVPSTRSSDGLNHRFNVGDLSKLTIIREEDGATRVMDGTRAYPVSLNGMNMRRGYFVNLLANQTYSLYITPPGRNPSFWPRQLRVMFADGWDGQRPCRGSVSLRVMPQSTSSGQWAVANSDLAWWRPCSGVSQISRWPYTYQASCFENRISLLLTLEAFLTSRVSVILLATSAPVMECNFAFLPCGIIPSGDRYTFNTSAAEQRIVFPPAVGYHQVGFDDSSWSSGPAIIGFVQYVGPTVKSVTQPPGFGDRRVRRITYYYRNTFHVADTSCFSALTLEFIPSAGVMGFLNGVEILRHNLNSSSVINSTSFALTQSNFTRVPVYNSVTVSLDPSSSALGLPALRQGVNVLAFETHVFRLDTYTVYFDARAFLLSRC